ncbi:hypothetical protein AB6A23_02450 [Paenibacillus tarimensis]
MQVHQRIEDYKLEELLRCPYRYHKREKNGGAGRRLNWRQHVQYAVGHIVNDYYTLPAEARWPGVVSRLADRRWPAGVKQFQSVEHYERTKLRAVSNLTLFLESEEGARVPMMLFEQWEAYHPDLQVNLSVIFQAVFAEGGPADTGYVIHKYVVNDDDQLFEAYGHLMTVYCSIAFPELPKRIEVLSVLNGKRHIIIPDSGSLGLSLDYMRLISGYWSESSGVKNRKRLTECRSCPFRRECGV